MGSLCGGRADGGAAGAAGEARLGMMMQLQLAQNPFLLAAIQAQHQRQAAAAALYHQQLAASRSWTTAASSAHFPVRKLLPPECAWC